MCNPKCTFDFMFTANRFQNTLATSHVLFATSSTNKSDAFDPVAKRFYGFTIPCNPIEKDSVSFYWMCFYKT